MLSAGQEVRVDESSGVSVRIVMMTRGPAVLATAAALAFVNLGLASLIVLAVGARGFAPMWLGLVLLVLGVMAAAIAVRLWRGYLSSVRGPSSTDA
jgi:hypothetical protein